MSHRETHERHVLLGEIICPDNWCPDYQGRTVLILCLLFASIAAGSQVTSG